jgi:hypothetical protein
MNAGQLTPVALPPLPDEDACGHAERVNRLNATPRDHRWIARSRPANRLTSTLLDWLTQACEIDSVSYLCNHTWLPFSVYTRGSASCIQTGIEKTYIHLYAFQDGWGQTKWCTRCAKEDQDTLGFSYWRRSHQLEGNLECPAHGTTLMVCETVDLNAHFPHETAERSRPLRIRRKGRDFLERYQTIASHMLLGPRRAVLDVWTALGARNVDIGPCLLRVDARQFYIPERTARSLMSDDWIREVESMYARRPQERQQDVVLSGAKALAAALAFRFSNVQDALVCLGTPSKSHPR